MPIVSNQSESVGASPDWQDHVKSAIRSGAELCRRLGLPLTMASGDAEQDFPVFAPLPYVDRIRPCDPRDPLLAQVLGVAAELATPAGYHQDPVGDKPALAGQGLLHKYSGRALLITTGVCAIHCRYCFRRHFPYEEQSASDMASAINVLNADLSIEEVLLSGGDPLSLSDQRLSRVIGQLEQVPHLRRLRIHSRLPIVIPSRITERLCRRLRESRLTTWMVVHVNHPNELDENTGNALERLVDAGIPTLNQSVLLHGVNDDADTLCELSERLIQHRVFPYYLHLLDKVAGAAHFNVAEPVGVKLLETMRTRLPGYAIPRLAREVPGEQGKQFLA